MLIKPSGALFLCNLILYFNLSIHSTNTQTVLNMFVTTSKLAGTNTLRVLDGYPQI